MENLYLGIATAKKWLAVAAASIWVVAFFLANFLDHSGLQFICILLTLAGFAGGLFYVICAGVNIAGALEKIEDKKNGNRYVSELDAGERLWSARLEKFGAWLAEKKKPKAE